MGFTSIPMPPWWTAAGGKTNLCDTGRYSGSYQLYANTYMPNLIPCGPMPIQIGYDVATEYFYSGALGELEWECVELSMRWMYQEYGISPYSVDGGVGVVWQYTGTRLTHIINDGNSGPENYSVRPPENWSIFCESS